MIGVAWLVACALFVGGVVLATELVYRRRDAIAAVVYLATAAIFVGAVVLAASGVDDRPCVTTATVYVPSMAQAHQVCTGYGSGW